ncbi:alpha/beta fold hydrolase [Winogradskyella maritima]|uniref:Alpha/beta hydrolase family protein n=1 Tax=Winogradskyella maritima TaxID=1517766 RepID=A0ABV8AH29_9FLAO|nr:alpha/beta fold hydrolase [Winogradskyella maritima]
MIFIEHILERPNKKPILIDLRHNESETQPIVIFCHGYKGYKDWGAWNLMADAIANAGFCVIKFNFSHNGGTMENPIDFPDLEAFGNNNYTKELEDLHGVVDWVQNEFKHDNHIDVSQISTIGHSRGGGIVLLHASEDSRIKRVITLASVCNFGKRSSTIGDLERWQKDGVKYVRNGRTNQDMPHYFQFYEDFKANEERLHIESAVKRLTIPTLIIHGNKDTSISMDEALNLYEWKPDSKLVIIENADHVFNTKQPWESDDLSPELKTVCEEITHFLKQSEV